MRFKEYNANYSADREAIVKRILSDSSLWDKVFAYFGIKLEEGEVAELEFKKAFNKFNFDF